MDVQLLVVFFKKESGGEPVLDWMRTLDGGEQKKLAKDIKTVELGWPNKGPPLMSPLGQGLWEIRTSLVRGEARIYCAVESGKLILLHGVIKKKRKASPRDIELARERLHTFRGST